MIQAKTSRNRAALRGSAATIALVMLATPAFAQQSAAASDATEDGTIVVTGSLIKNPNLVSSQPVTVTTAETIQLRASNVAEEVLRDIPGVVANIGSAVNNGNGGASYVDLRGLGSNRNLVLLDGVRLAPSELAGRVDLNNIPLALISRVDSLTGAAVTTYGADAISGVVNFITKKDFSGVDFQAGYGLTERGDGQYFRTDLTLGGNFADGKGNVVFSIGYQKSDPVYQGARDISIDNIDSQTGNAGGSGTAVPFRLSGLRPVVNGVPNTNPATPNGNLQFDPATGFARGLFSPFNFNPYNIFQTPFERFNLFGQANYEISDAVEVYTRGMFSRNTVRTIIAPSGLFGSQVTINLNNPFLPAGIRQQICAGNVGAAGTYTPRFTAAECDAAARATGPSDPNYRTYTGALARRTTEFGPRISNYQTTFFDAQAGLRGAVNSHIDWDISGMYGESENIQTTEGYVLISKARNSLLANNTTNCISSDPGCVPINWFGPGGSIDPAAAAYATGSATIVNRTSLGQVRALLSGDLDFSISGADAVGFALGGEYRKYTAQQRSDQTAKSGDLGGFGGAPPDIAGGYSVKEVYGEIIAPLIQDKPFFENLTVEAGARYSSYSLDATNDRSFDTFTWKAGGTWEMVPGFKVRGNYSRAVRAPNIGELFSPLQQSLTSLATDPCAGTADRNAATNTLPFNPAIATPLRRSVCQFQGAPASALGAIENPTAGQAQARTGGNLNLNPEKANTWTIGAVLQPNFAPGLAVTVDYFNIRVTDAITTPTAQDVINACFDNESVTNPACARSIIGRNALTGTLDGDASTTPGLLLPLTNQGRIETQGIDVTLSYSTDLGFAKLGLTGNATYTFNNTFTPTPTTDPRDCVGLFSNQCGSIQPEFMSMLRTTLGFEWVDVSVLWRHLSGISAEPGFDIQERFSEIPSYNYFDLTGRFNILENLTLTLTVTNLFDKQPPLVGSTAGSTAFNSGNTFPSTYDALGRRYTAQINVRF